MARKLHGQPKLKTKAITTNSDLQNQNPHQMEKLCYIYGRKHLTGEHEFIRFRVRNTNKLTNPFHRN